jgi:hypothetical protein
MPIGRYTVMDGDGRPMGTEEFRCAPGVAGWRYASEIRTDDPEPHREVVDLVVDADWRPVRTRIDTGAHSLLLEADGVRGLVGVRDGESIETPWDPETHLDYLSPAYNAVTANRLSATTEIDVVFLDAYTCVPSMERQRYEDGGVERVRTPVGGFEARRWRYTALSSGWSRDLWVAGDVVVAYDGLFSLESYEPGASGPAPIG